MKHMPKVMQDELKKSGTRSFSTSARSRIPEIESSVPGPEGASAEATAALADMIRQAQSPLVEENLDLKFDEPILPQNIKTLSYRQRYDTLQEQFTKQMMVDGKLTKAQKVWIRFYLTFWTNSNIPRTWNSSWSTSCLLYTSPSPRD